MKNRKRTMQVMKKGRKKEKELGKDGEQVPNRCWWKDDWGKSRRMKGKGERPGKRRRKRRTKKVQEEVEKKRGGTGRGQKQGRLVTKRKRRKKQEN